MIRTTQRAAFLACLRRNRKRLPIAVEITSRAARELTWRFAGISPMVSGQLDRGGIVIWIYWRGIAWDIVADIESAQPRRVAGGYVCSRCAPEARRVFRSRRRLWEAHTFDP